MSERVYETLEDGLVLEESISFAEFIRRYEGQRVEWQVGKVVVKMSNNPQHNFIVFFLAQVFSFFLSAKALGKVVTDGVSMYVGDDVPARQPDVMILLNEHLERITSSQVEGAADIVVEVVSPKTSSVDRGEKFIEYEAAGVKEYWLIDPLRQEADVFYLNDEGHYQRIKSRENLLESKVLQGFVLETSILWQAELPTGMAIVDLVKQMQD